LCSRLRLRPGYLFKMAAVAAATAPVVAEAMLEAGVLGHLHVHGTDVVTGVLRLLPPQGPETAERQPSGLQRQRDRERETERDRERETERERNRDRERERERERETERPGRERDQEERETRKRHKGEGSCTGRIFKRCRLV